LFKDSACFTRIAPGGIHVLEVSIRAKVYFFAHIVTRFLK